MMRSWMLLSLGGQLVRAEAHAVRNLPRCLYHGGQEGEPPGRLPPPAVRSNSTGTTPSSRPAPLAKPRNFSASARPQAMPASSPFEDDAVLYSQYNWMKSIPITAADKDSVPRMVVVHWEDGDSQRYPMVWLRSNCHCNACYSKSSHGKLKYTQHLDLNVQVSSISINYDNHTLSIKWNDDHVTTLPSNWLRCNRFDQSDVDPVSDAKLDLWGADVMSSGRLRFFRFSDLLESDELLLEWLSEIKALGIALIKEVPKTSHQIHQLAERIGYVMPSTFGTHSDIIAVDNPDMLGFSNGYLQPHTDFSYYVSPPGVALFHCLKNTSSSGGESLLIDGFKAAVELRANDPEAFRMLTTYEVEHVSIAANKDVTKHPFYHHSRHPLIRLNAFGQLKQITFNEIYHASLVRVPVDDVIPMYAAIKALNSILLREDNIFQYKLQPGDIISFDNHRMLHGRCGYTSDTGKVERHLQTCFVDWDCVLSKMRMLRKKNITSDSP